MTTKFQEVAQKLGAGITAAKLLEQAAVKFGINDPLTQAHFLAQIAVESANFTRTRENLAYRPERLLEVFPGRNGLRTLDQARSVVQRGQGAIAEAVYGVPWGRQALGNIFPGDGALFIGRGYKQLTGRGNYTAYSWAMYGDDRIVDNPTLLELPFDATMSAAWFFKTSKAWNAALADNVELVTRRINGGFNGLQARATATRTAKRLFGV